MKLVSEWFMVAAFLLTAVPVQAQLIPVNGGALVNDPSDKLTWLRDANFFVTQAAESGDPAGFVRAIIGAAGGVIYDTPNSLDTPANSGRHTLSTSDFYHNGVIDGHLTWFGAKAWVDYLNVTDYEGYSDWRLPTTVDNIADVGYPNGVAHDPAVTSSELAELFYGQMGQAAAQSIQATHNSAYTLFSHIGASYWSDTQVALGSSSAWEFMDSNGRQFTTSKASYNQGLAVRSGQAHQCDNTHSGTYHGNITVSGGLLCIVNATVTGNVQQTGGQLWVVGSIIAGNVQVNGGGDFTIGPGALIRTNLQVKNLPGTSRKNQICDTTVRGNLQFQNNGTAVEIGSASTVCAGNLIGGNMEVQNNFASTAVFDNIVVGNIHDHNNTAPTQVFNNFVERDLQCQNNSSIAGAGNSAVRKKGQCAGM